MNEYGIGKYDVEVAAAYLGKSRGKGTPQLEIVFEGELGQISAYRYFTEGGWQYFEKELIALGWDPAKNGYEFDALNTEVDEVTGQVLRDSCLKGARCQIVTKQETYTDEKSGEEKVSLKVQFINSIGRKREEMPVDEKKPFLTALRKNAIAWSGKPPSKPAAKPPAKPADRKERVQDATMAGIARAAKSQRLQGVTGPNPEEEPPEPASIPEDPPGDDWGSGRF